MKIYSPNTDMTVFLLCIVLLLVMRAMYAKNTRRYKLVVIALLNLTFVCMVSINYNHYVLPRAENYSMVTLNIVHNSLYILLIAELTIYLLYIIELVGIHNKMYIVMIGIMTAIYTVLVLTSQFTRAGFYVEDGVVHEYSQDRVYLIWYFMYIAIICAIVFFKKKVVNKKIFLTMVMVIIISMFITVSAFMYNTDTFITLSYYIPILAFFLLYHCNSYDSNLGSVNREILNVKVSSLIRGKNKFTFVEFVIPGFDKIENDSNVVEDFQNFVKVVHYNDYLFRYSKDTFVMIFDRDIDVNKLKKLFDEYHEKYGMSHKIVVAKSNPYCHSCSDYITLCKQYRESYEKIYIVNDEELQRFNKMNVIIKELYDIEEKGDLNDSRVKVFCQPILDVESSIFTTAESLMRLELNDYGMIYPDYFIPIAESEGKIHALTKIILNKVCQYIEAHPMIKRISVNLSMYEICKPNFYEEIIDIVSRYSFDRHKLGFELTESIEADNYELIRDILFKFKKLGITIYLDDFGTGYSNLEHIMKLPIDIIKFDKSLVVSSGQNEKSLKFVSSLSNMFNIIGYNILYEGIEDESDQNRCVKLKAQYLQGFRYSKPVPIEQMSDFIGKKYEDDIAL